MSISEFITAQPEERQELLSQLHEIIIQKDKTVTPVIAPMMGKEMIIYNAPGSFKYGLASVKKYMSLHVLPMYGSTVIYEKYKALLKDASFQKGCINFKNKDEMPLKIVKELIIDCSKIDLRAIRENYLKSKSKKK
jgi:replication-associated recombination protein RarA